MKRALDPTRGPVPVLLGLLSIFSSARAWGQQALPPWRLSDDIPLSPQVHSVTALLEETPLFSLPSRQSQRRGVVAASTPLPLFALTRGPGCRSRWLLVGPSAWLCEDQARFSGSQPVGSNFSVYSETDTGLPFDYYFVQRDGTPAYSRLRFVDIASPTATLDKGFGVAILQQRNRGGIPYGKTTYGLWIAMADLAPARAPTFHGQRVVGGKLDFGWILPAKARSYREPSLAKPAKTLHARFEKITITDISKKFGRLFYRIADGTWLRGRDVRRPTLSSPPQGVGPFERWIDVELSSQTLVAYEGARPVYATMISAGRGAQGTSLATPKGVHRIWVKLVSSTMDNFENVNANDYYSIEDVPFVQYFSKGVGLHAAFWHRRFGYKYSHGCVNLPPVDAQWLFQWTRPHLPAGWRAVFPSTYEPGTVVRVR